jgi:hypothetical protein
MDITLYWQYAYIPPSSSTLENLENKSKVKTNESIIIGSHEQKRFSQLQSTRNFDQKVNKKSIEHDEMLLNENHDSKTEQNVIVKKHVNPKNIVNGNGLNETTFNESQDSLPEQSTNYNDTMFGDEQVGRTYSPNELNSLRNVYQNNVHTDEEVDDNVIEANNAFKELRNNNDYTGESYESDKNHSKNYLATCDEMENTTNTQEYLVVGKKDSWDPNNTNNLPMEGNNNNVIIEISSFNFYENVEALRRNDIQRLFVGMDFLNYDPSELESQITMPKPEPNQEVHFNFRKSN